MAITANCIEVVDSYYCASYCSFSCCSNTWSRSRKASTRTSTVPLFFFSCRYIYLKVVSHCEQWFLQPPPRVNLSKHARIYATKSQQRATGISKTTTKLKLLTTTTKKRFNAASSVRWVERTAFSHKNASTATIPYTQHNSTHSPSLPQQLTKCWQC